MTTITLKSGATEVDIQNAINSLKGGGTVVLAANETVSIKSGLVLNAATRDITLDLNGSTLKQDADVNVIRGSGANEVPKSVTLGHDAAGHAVIEYATAPTAIKVGDWVKVISDDTLPGDRLDDGKTPTRLGEALQVLSVDGNKVTFAGDLNYADLYHTNVRASEIISGEISVRNGTIVGDQTHGWSQQIIQMRNTVDASISDLTIRDGSSRAIQIINGVNATVTDVSVINMINSGFLTGVAVQSLSSTGTTIDGLYAERVTHATDNNAIGVTAGSADPTLYGADINMTVRDSSAFNTTNFAWSWHSEGLNGTIDNVAAVNSFGFLDARGIGNTISDSMGTGNVRGIMLFEHGVDDARHITIDGVNLRDTQTYSVFVNGQPVDNLITNSVLLASQNNALLSPTVVTLVDTVIGKGPTNTSEIINGTADNNAIAGGVGADTINGAGGNDRILGGAGIDTLTGGTGRDAFVYHNISEGGDVIRDFTTGLNGDAIDIAVLAIRSGWSHDIDELITKGFVRLVQSGVNTLVQVDANGGGDGFTTLATLQNVIASDVLRDQFITRLSDTAFLTEQESRITAVVEVPLPPPASIDGNALDNELRTTAMATILNGLAGNDTLIGGETSDTLNGGAGNDTLTGGAGRNLLFGGDGNDGFIGGTGIDAFDGGTGIDRIDYSASGAGIVVDLVNGANNTGDAAGDTFTAIESYLLTAHADRFTGDDLANILQAGAGDDILSGGGGNDTLAGDAGNDTIRGGDGNDDIRGGDGDDLLMGGAGADTFNGGGGNDIVSYAEALTGVTVAMDGTGTTSGNDASGDKFTGIEQILGSRFNDTIFGDLRGNTLDGGLGNDLIDGGAGIDQIHGDDGNDTIIGGAGIDHLWGGLGDDSFRFDARTTFGDFIHDFESGHDLLQVSRVGLGIAQDAAYTLVNSSEQPQSLTGPTFVYNAQTGLLSFDADGTGGAAAIAVARLDNVSRLGLSDIALF